MTNNLAPTLLAIFFGGGLGCVARFAVSMLATRLCGMNFPWGTLAVNLVGAFCIGLFIEAMAIKNNAHPLLPYLLVTGFLGGFTTFSAFSLESAQMWIRGAYAPLIIYICVSVIGTLAMVLLALRAARRLF